MGIGSRADDVDIAEPIRWTPATLAWMAMMLAETMHAYAREVFIAPALGALRARQLGVAIGSILVLLVAWAFARWIGARSRRAQVLIGGFWVALTLVFEFSLGRAMHLSWSRLLSDYNPAQGGFMLLGLAVMFFSLRWVSRWPGGTCK